MSAKENARGQGGRKESYRREMEHAEAHESNHAPAQAGLTPSFDAARSYRQARLELIPLRARDKVPADRRWQAREYDDAQTLERARRGGLNLGVRLPADVVVVDVDPRNFPEGRDTGLPLTWEHLGGSKANPWAPSIDRLDCSQGYVSGNVRVVCWAFNQMRGDFPDEAVFALAKAVAARAP